MKRSYTFDYILLAATFLVVFLVPYVENAAALAFLFATFLTWAALGKNRGKYYEGS